MRIAKVIFAGSVAGAVALASPASARHSDAQKPASSSPCQAYEMGPDGAWHQQPCQEAGAPAQAPRKSAAHSGVGESQTH
jgi:hypothetical protein